MGNLPVMLAAMLLGWASLAAAWNPPVLVERGATYGRLASAADGRLWAIYEKAGKVWTKVSRDAGKTWGDPTLVAESSAGIAANPEILRMEDGTLVCAWNDRPARRSGGRHAIRLAWSMDGGLTWSRRDKPVFEGGEQSSEGVWEPAMAPLGGERIALVFADEASVGHGQRISVMESEDRGRTWSPARSAAHRAGHRDGMPVPLVLGQGVAVAIEDNGVAPGGKFRPVIVWTPAQPLFHPPVAGGDSRRWEALATPPRPGSNLAAPYLVRLADGRTALSVQSDELSPGNPECVVYLGDEQARGFASPLRPFEGLAQSACKWNSLHVLRDGRLVVLSDTTLGGLRGVWIRVTIQPPPR